MKNILLSFFILTCFITCKAQSKGSITIYGYRQVVLPGTIPQDVMDDDGNRVKTAYKPRHNFFIYTASNSRIYPSEIWIDGQAYSAKTEMIAQTPVEYINPTSLPADKKIALVPKTSKKVMQLSLAPMIESKSMAKAKTLSKTNQLVVVYKQGGRSYYSVLKKFTELEPVAMQ